MDHKFILFTSINDMTVACERSRIFCIEQKKDKVCAITLDPASGGCIMVKGDLPEVLSQIREFDDRSKRPQA